jgi:hypothetical protein
MWRTKTLPSASAVPDDLAAEQAAEQATIQHDLAAAGITQADIDAAQTTFQDDQDAVQASIDAATGNS